MCIYMLMLMLIKEREKKNTMPSSYIINDVNYVYATMNVSNDLASNKRYFITPIND